MFHDHLGDCVIKGEQAQFKLAVYNLLDNARKYSPSDTSIQLECHVEKNEAVIIVRNQGGELPTGENEDLFKKYYRGGNSMNTSGAGLGLWRVKKIVEQHRGTVNLKGTSFGAEAMIRIPLAESDEDVSFAAEEDETGINKTLV
jgi:K+-sensing histidine kinase KdpD